LEVCRKKRRITPVNDIGVNLHRPEDPTYKNGWQLSSPANDSSITASKWAGRIDQVWHFDGELHVEIPFIMVQTLLECEC
jgi:hypothetical protein